jgi:hypothetical protein
MSATQSLPLIQPSPCGQSSWLYDAWTEICLDRNISRKKKIEQILKSKQDLIFKINI